MIPGSSIMIFFFFSLLMNDTTLFFSLPLVSRMQCLFKKSPSLSFQSLS